MNKLIKSDIFSIVMILFWSLMLTSCKTDDQRDKAKNSAAHKKDSYIPLIEGSTYTYKCLFNNEESTNKIEARKAVNSKGQTFYYFIDNEVEFIDYNMFGGAIFRINGNNLMTLSSFEIIDLQMEYENFFKEVSLKNETILFPKSPQIGTESLSTDFKSKIKIIFSSIEDVKVPAGTFRNCIKLSRTTTWDDDGETEKEIAWFKKGVGMVKWIRRTGRIDELVEYHIPSY